MKLSEIDLNNLDYKEIGIWPLPLRIFALILIGAGVTFLAYKFIIGTQVANLERLSNEQSQLRNQYSVKYRKSTSLESYREQLINLNKDFSKVLDQMPSSKEIGQLVENMSNQAKTAGLEYTKIKPKNENIKEFYTELPIELSLTGYYHGFGEFASLISQMPRIVTLHDFNIKRKIPLYQKTDEGVDISLLQMNVVAKTYWSVGTGGEND